MMIKIWNKLFNTKPDVNFWCEKDGLEDLNPITKSIQSIPQWFKNMKSEGTIKKCPGLIDYFNLGYIHYLWTDITIEIPEDRRLETQIRVPDPNNFNIQMHSKDQYLDHIPTDQYKYIMKPISPWRCKTNKGYSMLQLPLYYEFNDVFDVMPGVINTDYYHQLHPQVSFKKTGRFILPRGLPLCMLIPFKRTKWSHIIKERGIETYKWENKARMKIQTKWPGEYKLIKKND
tara:strand:- start:96 stop:788 length:693 start_codon:yes stop_codon:yes gene_type:complete